MQNTPIPKMASARSGWVRTPSTTATSPITAAIGTNHCEHRADRVEDRHLLDRQRHRRQFGDGLVAHDVDHLRSGDLHRPARTDDASVGIGDDVGEELGGLRVAGVAADAEHELVLRDARASGPPPGRRLPPARRGARRSAKTSRATARLLVRVEGDALHPPAAGGQGEQDGGDEEQQPGESAAHPAKSGKDRRRRRIGDATRRLP